MYSKNEKINQTKKTCSPGQVINKKNKTCVQKPKCKENERYIVSINQCIKNGHAYK